MKNIEGEIIVIDNHSNDDSFSFFQNRFPQVQFIWNATNSGFAKANNQALKLAKGEYILFLNPDTIVPEDCFNKSIEFIKSNHVALGIRMLDGEGNFLKESKRSFPSPMTSLYKLFGLAKLFPHSKTFAKYHLGYLSENENHEVDVLAGAYMMIPKRILDKVGGFDEDFFMYGEDIDLSYRIQKAGFKNYYFAESCILHFKGESTKKGSLNYVKMFYKAMSIFVKKHYGSQRAGLYSFFIHIAIFIRASFSALSRLLKWIGLPVIDAGIILTSFWFIKFLWNTYIKQDVNYSPNLLIIAFPAFTLLFLIASYFSGLYDNGFKQSRLNKSTLISVLVLLSVYSLLPESVRFSRGILVFGSLAAFTFMTVVRILLVKWKIIEYAIEKNTTNQTVITGSREEYTEVNNLLAFSDKSERILGRVETDNTQSPDTIGSFHDLKNILGLYLVKEIIFCEGSLSFKQIIESLPQIPGSIQIQFFASGCNALIGSNDKNTKGEIILTDQDYRLNEPLYIRSKKLFDISFSLFLLLIFPVHFIIKKRPLAFFKNIFNVLSGKNTWIGYAEPEKKLPLIKKGIITTTGLASGANTLPPESLFQTDKLYAKHYNILTDLKLVWNNFHFLS